MSDGVSKRTYNLKVVELMDAKEQIAQITDERDELAANLSSVEAFYAQSKEKLEISEGMNIACGLAIHKLNERIAELETENETLRSFRQNDLERFNDKIKELESLLP